MQAEHQREQKKKLPQLIPLLVEAQQFITFTEKKTDEKVEIVYQKSKALKITQV